MSDWISWNMVIKSFLFTSVQSILVEEVFFFIVTFYLFNFYQIFTEYTAVDTLLWVSHWLLTSPPPPRPKKNALLTFHNSLCRSGLRKVFRKASLGLWRNKCHDWKSLLRPISSGISSTSLAAEVKDWSWAREGKIGYCELCFWRQRVFGLTSRF